MHFIRTLFDKGIEKFNRDAEEWGLSRRSALVIALLPISLMLAMTIITALAVPRTSPLRPVFRWITAEDSLLEWSQFLFILAACLLFTWLGLQLIRSGHRGIGWLYLLAAAGALLVAGEEISWGQRVFGWGTPEALDALNHQGETNIHNIRPVQRAFGYAVLMMGMYGVLIPLLKSRLLDNRLRFTYGHLLIPPLCLVSAFLMPFSYRFFRLVFWPRPDYIVVKFGEAPELCLYFGLLLFAWLNMRRLHQGHLISATNVPAVGETISSSDIPEATYPNNVTQ